jgi:hypothetical protein
MVNVYNPDSSKLIEKSQNTTTPLQHVPFVVFYLHGKPFKVFDGQYNSTDFKNFLAGTEIEAGQPKNHTGSNDQISPYSTGKPKSAKVCYLSYQNAY